MTWAKKALGVTDWTIKLWIQDEPPPWAKDTAEAGVMGNAQVKTYWKIAKIWVSNSRCLHAQESPLASLFHEIGHVVADDNGFDGDESRLDYFLNRLSTIMAKAYSGSQN